MTEKNNLALWNSVYETDPASTRHVAQRGGFTAIDAYYQFQRATERFGPLGIGWGFDADYSFQEGAVVCVARLWYVLDGKRSEAFPICTMNKLHQGNGIDEDAGKKALTDALTKGLSYLGFSADVFMRKFDDNKYVEGLLAKQSGEEQSSSGPVFKSNKERTAWFNEVKAAIDGAETITALKEVRSHYLTTLEALAASVEDSDGTVADNVIQMIMDKQTAIKAAKDGREMDQQFNERTR